MKKIFTIIVIILVILLAVWYLGNASTGSTDGSSLSVSQSSSDSADAQYIYSLLQQMGQVKLDDSIFSNPTFQALKDNTVSFSSQPAGRLNPFAPVGSTGAPVVSTTTIKVRLK